MSLYPILPMSGCKPGSISGSVGRLAMIPIEKLRVDDAYQRNITAGSARNIGRICSEFDWAKFLPVIVVGDGEWYSIVDGQHRTTAAATLGLPEVPCYVLSCTAREAAAAFAAINGNVTPMAPVDIWFAELAAGKPETVQINEVLAASDVRVVRKKDGFAPGETRSVGVLRRAYALYGPATLTTVLQCIVQCGNGNPGMIIGAVVNGIGMAVRTKPALLNEPTRLFDMFDKIDISEMLRAAGIEFARTNNPVQFVLTRQFNAILAGRANG